MNFESIETSFFDNGFTKSLEVLGHERETKIKRQGYYPNNYIRTRKT